MTASLASMHAAAWLAAFQSGHAAEFDRLTAEIVACRRLLAEETCEHEKDDLLRSIGELARRRASLVPQPIPRNA